MSTLAAKAYHPINGSTEDVWEGFSWPCLFFGCFWYLYKSMWAWAVISVCLAVITFGVSWLVFPFFANAQYASSLRKQGYLSEREWDERKQAGPGANISGSKQQRKESSIADELAKLAALREQGILSQEEFINQKRKLLS